MADVQCENCGAVAASHAAACDFCQAPLGRGESAAASSGDAAAQMPGLSKLYGEGKVQGAMVLMNNLLREKPELEKDVNFLLLEAKLLLETEGATGHIKLILNKAFLLSPKHPDVVDYRAIVDAKEKLDLGLKQHGEELLRSVLRRKPNHPHALLLMGTHLYWGKTDLEEAIRYLENCIRARPVMLRAWACLGAVNATLGRRDQAERAFKKCLDLETNPKMVDYFKGMLKGL